MLKITGRIPAPAEVGVLMIDTDCMSIIREKNANVLTLLLAHGSKRYLMMKNNCCVIFLKSNTEEKVISLSKDLADLGFLPMTYQESDSFIINFFKIKFNTLEV